MKEYFDMPRPEMLSRVPENITSLLDVGCSSGLFAQSVKRKTGATVWGIEPNNDAFLRADKLLDEVFCGFFEDVYTKIDRKFDLITFNDVLEHMVNPWETLKKCLEMLTPNGKILASLPHVFHFQNIFDNFFAQDWKYEDAGIMDKTHLRWFTRKSIERMFDESGYVVEKIEGIDPTPSRKMTLINLISLYKFKDMRYPQFAVLASPKPKD